MNIYDKIINQFESLFTMSKLLGHNALLISFTEDCNVLWISNKHFTITITAWKRNLEMTILVSNNSYKAKQNKTSIS